MAPVLGQVSDDQVHEVDLVRVDRPAAQESANTSVAASLSSPTSERMNKPSPWAERRAWSKSSVPPPRPPASVLARQDPSGKAARSPRVAVSQAPDLEDQAVTIARRTFGQLYVTVH